jgi:dephospho-CoA kinase
MLVIGLTGGMGSGKSTVAHLFEKKGIKIIDADQLARSLTQPGCEAFNKITAHFDNTILLPDGTLNRKRLRTIIFKDTSQRVWLEQLLHPLIRIEMQREVESAQSPYCIIVIPLLFETKPNPIINRILVVDATEEQQLKRIQQRDQSTLEEAKAILQSQVSREYRLANAIDIIHNNGSIDDLHQAVDTLHNRYLTLRRTLYSDSR